MAYSTGLTPPDRQGPWASSFAQPYHAQPATIQQHAPVAPLPIAQKRRPGTGVALLWVAPVLGIALLALIWYFTNALGPAASTVGFIVALIPLTIVLIGVRIVDRWEPEPVGTVIFALGWGAVASVSLALLFDLAMVVLTEGAQDRAVMQAVVQAPIVEEIAKAIGLVLIAVFARRSFDGPVDGVVYGALIAAGFAFTENIQYFAVSLLEGGTEQLSVTFFLRGILSPFAHVMFTAIIGFSIGLATRRGRNIIPNLILGLAGAILLHMLWNWSATFTDFIGLYFTLHVPLFIGFIVGIILLKREERRLTMARLGEYASAGWFSPQEVVMLATSAGRRDALAWAGGLGKKPIMRGFIRTANQLAATRQRAITGRDPHAAEEERELLERAMGARFRLLTR